MNSIKKLIAVVAILIFVGVLIQTYRIMYFSKFTNLKQKLPNEKVNYMSVSDIPENYFRILLVKGPDDYTDEMILTNAIQTFKHAKLNYEIVSMKDFPDSINKYSMLVFATEDFGDFEKYELFRTYINNGGKAVFLTRTYDKEINYYCGINSNFTFKNDKGIVFNERIFPGLADLSMGDLIDHSILDVKLIDDVRIIAETKNKNPLIWTRDINKGRIVYVNSSMLEDKLNRGVLLQTITMGADIFLTSILNSKIFYIDDFPAPLKPGSDEVIQKYYGMTNRNFYKHIWWSDMYNLAKKYNLKYTGAMIGIYNLDVIPPFESFNNEDIKDFEFFGRKLVETGGEISIHGYNHNSLAMGEEIEFEDYNYRSWKSIENMEKSLKKLEKLIIKIFGDIEIYTYVPPSNLLPHSGKMAVASSLKDLKVFGGVYYGDKTQKGLLLQEMGRDPNYNDIYAVPRISSGYLYDKVLMWEIYNAVAHLGMFNHFVHPDDLLDYERSNNYNWKELFEGLNRIISEVNENHFYLRPMTSMEFIDFYQKYEKLEVYWYQNRNEIEVYYKNFAEPVYHYLRLKNRRIKEVINGSFTQISKDKNNKIYLVKGENKNIRIELL